MVYLTMGETCVVPKVAEHVEEQDVLRETVDARTAAQERFQKRTRSVTTCPRPPVYSKAQIGMLNNHTYFILIKHGKFTYLVFLLQRFITDPSHMFCNHINGKCYRMKNN